MRCYALPSSAAFCPSICEPYDGGFSFIAQIADNFYSGNDGKIIRHDANLHFAGQRIPYRFGPE